MEKRVSSKVDAFFSIFKEKIRERAQQMGIIANEQVTQLLQYIFDYNRLSFMKEDFQKRKRIKNFIPIYDRCCAKRASNEQCTRRRKPGFELCGTHLKGTPHGIMEMKSGASAGTQIIEVFAQDIQGILYYIDKYGNVYRAEDIVCGKQNPKIIAKYVKEGNVYRIPELNL